jgi:chromate transporter
VVGLAEQGDSVSPTIALQICLLFGGASLLSIGGGNSVVPEIELQAVGTYHWLTQAQFADLFALAQAAPGPSILIVTLVGYSAAGVMGALLATAAMVLPAGILVFIFARLWGKVEASPWRVAFEHGLAPVAVGLIAASGVIVARAADHGTAQYLLTALATVVFCATRVSPIFVVASAGLVGWLGLV